jgi:hypothetical protein
MAIHSTLLGSVQVSGKEAKALRQAMKKPVASPATVEAVLRGRKLAKTIVKKGSVTVALKSVRTGPNRKAK